MYRLTNIAFHYERQSIFKNITLTIAPTDHIVCIGPSGIGKSTFLHLLAGLLTPTSGDITYNNAPVIAPVHAISVLLQKHSLFPWKTVLENILLPLQVQKTTVLNMKENARTILTQLGLYEYQNSYPYTLSGGQQQRTALGRALITNPDMLLMDEPFSSLDEITRETMQQYILTMSHTYRTGYVLITHSLQEALFLGERLLLFQPDYTITIKEISNPFFSRAYDDLTAEEMQSYTNLHRQLHNALASNSLKGDTAHG